MSASHTILLVDDDADFVDMNRQVLETAGYAVVCAATTQDALARLAAGTCDLVVTDLMMGSLDSGFSLAAEIRQTAHLRHIPVIMATSVSRHAGLDFRPRTQDELARMNVDAYFDKPVRPDALIAKIEELLKR
ncbi:MAG: response regulator [Phycisphaerae bacterium]|nr:response regulator [Phycisphaerae bacterium]